MILNRTLMGFIKKELNQTLRDPRMRSLLIMAPIIQMTLFGYALSNEVRNIRLAVFAEPLDHMAKAIEIRCYASKWFVPATHFAPNWHNLGQAVKHGDLQSLTNSNNWNEPLSLGGDPFALVLAGKADAVLVAPAGGIEKAIARGADAKESVQLLVDATNSVRAQSVQAYFNSVLQAEFADRYGTAGVVQPGIDLSVRMLYNPSMDTSYFMVPGILAMLLLLVTMTLTSSSITREKELGTFETLISAPIARWEVILGKTLPYVFLGLLDMPLILIFARVVFGVPMSSPMWWWQIPVGGLVFICATVGVGTLISTAARTQQQAMMTGFFVTFPAQMLSGIMYPLENMPLPIYALTFLNPLRYFVAMIRNITLKGGDNVVFWMNVWPMALIAIFTVGFSFYRFRQRLN
jgi:ABC-2 type transport system permease protein